MNEFRASEQVIFRDVLHRGVGSLPLGMRVAKGVAYAEMVKQTHFVGVSRFVSCKLFGIISCVFT